MAGPKTAAKNRAHGKVAQAGNNAEHAFIVACNAGKHAYVRSPNTSLNPHMATDSQAFVDAIAAIHAAGRGDKVDAELLALATSAKPGAWPSVLERLRAEQLVA